MEAPTARALVVDPGLVSRRSLRNRLLGLGFAEVLEAADGSSAWRVLRADDTGVDLVVAEQDLPGLSGLELLLRVRADPSRARIPFLMVSHDAERENVRHAIRLGVSGYLVRPVTHEVLRRQLEAIGRAVA